jgi:hypothetical protein
MGVAVKIAVVFVSYLKVPEQRLQDHFRWNHTLYESLGDRLRVYVVSDTDHTLPSYASCVIYPMDQLPMIEGRRRFCLTRTKNRGLDAAIEDEADVIVCTDVDIAFPPEAFARLVRVDETRAAVPVYRMAPSYEQRHTGKLDHGCTGTVVMTAERWKTVRYDEECVEYGADDGILLRDIERAGLTVKRDVIVAHIAHAPGDGDRTPGRGAATCWGRESGFNRDNFKENRKLHSSPRRRC